MIISLRQSNGGVGEGNITLSVTGDLDGEGPLPPEPQNVGLTVCSYPDNGPVGSEFAVVQTTGLVIAVEDGETVQYDLIFRPSAQAQPGTYPIIISASEEATISGRVETHRDTVFLTIDPPVATPPTVSITAPADGSTVQTSTVTLKGTATDDVGVESLSYQLNSGPELTVPLNAPITTWTFDVPGLSVGANVIDVLARDVAGHLGSAAVTVNYEPSTSQLACFQVLEGTMALGDRVAYDLAVPRTDTWFAFRVESIDLDGTFEYLEDDAQQFATPVVPGFLFDRLEIQQPTTRYTIALSADNTGGDYRLYLECERPMTLNTNIPVTQQGGRVQLHRFVGTTDPIHIGVHRPQVVNPVLFDVWYPGGQVNLNPVGNQSGGYHTEFLVQPLPSGAVDHTTVLRPSGFSPNDVDEYTFGISTVAPPTALTLDASNAATVTDALDHLGHLRYYSFTGSTNESYTVTLEHSTGMLAGELVVERMGASSPFYQSPFVPLATGRTTRGQRTTTVGPFVLPADGTYTIRIGANGSETYDAALAETSGAFTLSLQRQ